MEDLIYDEYSVHGDYLSGTIGKTHEYLMNKYQAADHMNRLRARLATLEAERAALVTALEGVEWILDSTRLYEFCPSCGESKEDGHLDTCVTSLALAAVRVDPAQAKKE